jgi:hypothetical protein
MDQMLVAVDRNKTGAVLLKLDIVLLLLLLHTCSDLTVGIAVVAQSNS